MIFRTEIFPLEAKQKIDYNSKILQLGSCFANNIGQKLTNYKFMTEVNPFGVLYNPESIAQSLDFLLSKKIFTKNDVFQQDGINHSFYHHSKFSNTSQELMLNNINEHMHKASTHLKKSDFLLITFGTAWIFEFIKTKQIVSNCHKISANKFRRLRLSVSEITTRYTKLIEQLLLVNPKLNIILTVSPIRHLKDGAQDNQVSKSTLILAVHELCERFTNTHYFPTYELVMDDLRDYRFYADDMTHPSEIAIQYIWNKFKETYISRSAISVLSDIDKITKALQHRPFQPLSDSHQAFLRKQLEKINSLEEIYSMLDFSDEKNIIQQQLT